MPSPEMNEPAHHQDHPPAEGPQPRIPGIRRRHGELVAGSVFVGLGAAFALTARTYGLGTWDEMGAGMFPFAVGLFLVGLGIAVGAGAVRGGEVTEGLSRIPWRAILCVGGSIVAFAYLIPIVGLVPTTVVTVLVSALASPATGPFRALLATVAITVACYVVFVLALQLRLPLYWF